jgi:hypothetical protein
MSTGDKLDRIAAAVGDTPAPATNPENFSAVLEAIVIERGGAAAFSPSQIAAARRLAQLLIGEGRVDAPGLSALQAMLPPLRSAAPESKFDLTGFSDQELREFGRLIAKASGRTWHEPAGATVVIGHGSREWIDPGNCDCASCKPRTPHGEIIPVVHGGAAFAHATRCDCPACERAREAST